MWKQIKDWTSNYYKLVKPKLGFAIIIVIVGVILSLLGATM